MKHVVIAGGGPLGLFLAIRLQQMGVDVTVLDPDAGDDARPGTLDIPVFDYVQKELKVEISPSASFHIKDLTRELNRLAADNKFNIKIQKLRFSGFAGKKMIKTSDGKELPCDLIFDATGSARAVLKAVNAVESKTEPPFVTQTIGENPEIHQFMAYVKMADEDIHTVHARDKYKPTIEEHAFHLEKFRHEFGWKKYVPPFFEAKQLGYNLVTSQSIPKELLKRTYVVVQDPLQVIVYDHNGATVDQTEKLEELVKEFKLHEFKVEPGKLRHLQRALKPDEFAKINQRLIAMGEFPLTKNKMILYLEIPPELKADKYGKWVETVLHEKTGKPLKFERLKDTNKKGQNKKRWQPFNVKAKMITKAAYVSENSPIVIPISDAQLEPDYRTGKGIKFAIERIVQALLPALTVKEKGEFTLNLKLYEDLLAPLMTTQSEFFRDFYAKKQGSFIKRVKKAKEIYQAVASTLDSSHQLAEINVILMENEYHQGFSAFLQALDVAQDIEISEFGTLTSKANILLAQSEMHLAAVLNGIDSVKSKMGKEPKQKLTQIRELTENALVMMAVKLIVVADRLLQKKIFPPAEEYLKRALKIFEVYFPGKCAAKKDELRDKIKMAQAKTNNTMPSSRAISVRKV